MGEWVTEVLIIGIPVSVLAAFTAFWIDEWRAMWSCLGLAVLLSFLAGDRWFEGAAGFVILSPSLLVTFPLARWLKRRYQRRKIATQRSAPIAPRSTTTPEARAAAAARRKAEEQRKREAHAAERAARMDARLAEDPISAVLCPQVPIRFEETPRSWLGGLPQMPGDIPWPRSGPDNKPLHFAAQICCADLPGALWAGQGPRDGWLLLFIDGFRAGQDDGEGENAWSTVIHINALGPERAAPDDLHGVHDLIMSGPNYDAAFDQSDVPSVWRKWPIDIIPQKVVLEKGKVVSFSARDFALKSTTAQELYGIVSNADDHPRLDPLQCPPLTWHGALSFIKMAIKFQRENASRSPADPTAAFRQEPGWVNAMIGELEHDLKKPQQVLSEKAARLKAYETAMKENDTEALAALDASDLLKYPALKKDVPALEARVARIRQTIDRLHPHTSPEAEQALSDEIAANAEGTPQWWADQGKALEAVMNRITTKDLDTPLPAADWEAIKTQVYGMKREIVRPERRYKDDRKDGLKWEWISVADRAWTHNVAREHYLDVYAHSPAMRDLIPSATQDKVAEIARAINWGRPHRMGGLADPLQGDIGPDASPLLFQIASDDALNWMWGDSGAIYIYTSAAELETLAFKGQGYLECH